ncbi:O-antigen ligase family protein [Candidatus Beckwithbacteria bacterium]|nr:O-antigen ligase family protein [Candidatus Beckwithbacteria bacterium]
MQIKKILKFIDNNLLFGLCLFLLAFIPLYPKWPLFDILEGYNVRIRLEDFLVLLTFIIWFVYVLRDKINLKKIPLLKPILLYIIVGFVSILSALFITKTVFFDTYQILKVFLHWFRRIEYFSLFFVYFSAIYDKKQIKAYLAILVTTIIGVTTYGFGQKYLYWPAYSTMNREFSKGIKLYLSEHARVLSTFAGHYDLAAFVMMTLIFLLVLLFMTKNKWLKFFLGIITFLEYWILILTSSRTSFLAYLGALTIVFFLLALKKSWKWAIPRYFLVFFISMIIMLSLGDLSDRFAQVIHVEDFKNNFHRALNNLIPKPENGIAIDDISEASNVIAMSDVPPSTIKPKLPADVTYAPPIEIPILASESSEATAASGAAYTYTPRTFSNFAQKYGLSLGIRFDVLWVNALNAFMYNPVLGTGYSTLVKATVNERTTAESTDNDYLRALGETGILGLAAFLFIFYVILKLLYQAFKKTSNEFYYSLFAIGIAMTLGLLINATLIDVFEASKVAYFFWSMIGFFLALVFLVEREDKKKESKIKK